MKKVRMLACLVFAFVVFFCLNRTIYAAGVSDFNISGGVLISYSGNSENVVIPDGVTAINANAFENATRIKSVTIPSSVESIGDWAFYHCISLTSVNIPNSVVEIGTYVFADCTSLKSVDLSTNLTKIDWGVFAGCSNLTNITIPSGVKEIGNGAFSECSFLQAIVIPSSVTTIGDSVFSSCSDLKRIENNADVAIPLDGINGYTWYDAASGNAISSVSKQTAVNRQQSDTFTVYDGIDYAPVYDYLFYAQNNPDVVAAVGYNPEALLWHFVNYGMAEGRYAKQQFNVLQYMYGLLNDDLRAAYGGDMKMYYYHYINFGRYEGRSVSDYDSVFSPEYYLANNQDVYDSLVSRYSSDGNINGWAIWHYCEFGMNEGRRGNANFGVMNYLAANKDVYLAYGNNYKAATIHYLQYGNNRNLVGKVDIYKIPQLRPDVVEIFGNDINSWIKWYVNYGISGL